MNTHHTFKDCEKYNTADWPHLADKSMALVIMNYDLPMMLPAKLQKQLFDLCNNCSAHPKNVA